MSIFSSIRRAKEHNAKVAEQKKKQQAEAPRQPYRHIPTHAASDAFASAPPSWREAADRPKIMEQNRRRTAMEANTMPMMPVNFHGIPRVRSTSSFVTYSGALAANDSRPYRTYSYTTSSPHLDRGRDAVYTNPDMSMSQPSMPQRLGDRAGRVVSTHKPPPMPFPFGTGTAQTCMQSQRPWLTRNRRHRKLLGAEQRFWQLTGRIRDETIGKTSIVSDHLQAETSSSASQ